MEKIFVCPVPYIWNDIYKNLLDGRNRRSLDQDFIPQPPVPLILGGWAASNDVQKKFRWEITISWAKTYGFLDLIPELNPDQKYEVFELTDYVVGPMGGPLYLPWNFEPRPIPEVSEVKKALAILKSNWVQVAGPELAEQSWPSEFTGKKFRRLVVIANTNYKPSWGTWDKLLPTELRRTFTKLRKKVNEAIHPLEVDHIDFIENNNFDEFRRI